jgi:regulator of sigma E protease
MRARGSGVILGAPPRMSQIPYYLAGVLGLSLLVIVHECGHYFVARAFGMRVLRFSIGLGPAIVRYTPKGSPTTFQLCAIPLLAYVQIAGMNPAEDVDRDDPELFPNKSVFARIATIAAGSLANYLSASVLFFGLALVGLPEAGPPVSPMRVEEVAPDSAAKAAGILAGDLVREADGQPVRDVRDVQRITKQRGARPTAFVIERDGRRRTLTLTPKLDAGGTPRIGVVSAVSVEYVSKPFGEALRLAALYPFVFSAAQAQGIYDMIRRLSGDGLISPRGMTEEAAKAAKRGPSSFVLLLIHLSIAIGFSNLLPFPALDGGRLVFLGYEVVTRRRPNERFEAIVHLVGMVFLLSVVVAVMISGR